MYNFCTCIGIAKKRVFSINLIQKNAGFWRPRCMLYEKLVLRRIVLSIPVFIITRNRMTISICKIGFYGITADETTETYYYRDILFLIRPLSISSARQRSNFFWFSHSQFLPQMLRDLFQFKDA